MGEDKKHDEHHHEEQHQGSDDSSGDGNKGDKGDGEKSILYVGIDLGTSRSAISTSKSTWWRGRFSNTTS